jgi:hypothetical protein
VNIVPTDLNQRLASALRYSVAAERSYLQGRTAFWRFIGVGLLGLGLGIGVGIGCYGYSYIAENTYALGTLSSELSKALSETHLRATAQGTVQIEPHELALAKDQIVSLEDNSRVYLDPNARVTVSGEINIQTPTMSVPNKPITQPSAAIPTIVDFTVFKRVSFDKGAVFTGWNFLTSAQKFPSSQYCYYTEKLDASPFEPVIFIGTDERLERPKQLPKGFDIASAFSRCVWFNRESP